MVAQERATLYGLPVYAHRRVQYGPLDPVESRKIFIRCALVEGDWESRAPFFAHNRRLVREIETLEHKSRRPDVLVDDELIYAFYDSLIPAEVCNGAGFDAWRTAAERKNPKLLFLDRDDLMRHEAAGITTEHFPHQLEFSGRTLRARVPPRSRRPARRRDDDRAADRAEPGERGALRVAGARAC